MALLQHYLDLFEFTDMAHVTANSLKRAFKKSVIKYHPDKGGENGSFDDILAGYVYLSEMVRRLCGGRNARPIFTGTFK